MKNLKNRRFMLTMLKLAVLFVIGMAISNIAFSLFKSEQTPYEFYNEMVDSADKINYAELINLINEGKVDDAYYMQTDERMVVTLFNDTSETFRGSTDRYRYEKEDTRVAPYTAEENFRKTMLEYGVDLYMVQPPSNTALTLIVTLVPNIIFIVIMLATLKRMSNITGSDIQAEDILGESDTKLSDIIGLDEVLFDIECIIQLIKDPSKGEAVGAKVPHGILLSGPAGVGKTMIAKAIAHEAGVPFIQVSGSDFIELYVGNGAKRVRQVFKIAREHSPCIIFIDEFDALGTKRDSVKATSEDTKTVNALLKEMDGFKPLDGVFVIAATNFSDKLDEAVTRSGRFDREVNVLPPRDWQVRKELFNMYLKNKRLSDDVDIDMLARTVSEFTGADISSVCNEAALIAMSKDTTIITHEFLEEAIDRKLFKGSYSKSKVNEEDRRVVAYHEAGHAVVSHVLGLPISRASIRSTTSGVGGAVIHMDLDTKLKTREYFWNRVLVCYGGRASEESTFGSITTGASNDIKQATSLLCNMVYAYGFDKNFGLLNLNVIQEAGIEYEDDGILHQLSKSAYEACLDLITSNKDLVTALAEKLLEVEAMSGEQIAEFFKEFEN